MILTASACRDCHSSHLILNGKTQAGNQRYKCKDCGSTKVLQLDERYSAARQELVAQTYVERNSARSVGRIFGISHRTVFNSKKAQTLPPLKSTLADGHATEVLEVVNYSPLSSGRNSSGAFGSCNVGVPAKSFRFSSAPGAPQRVGVYGASCRPLINAASVIAICGAPIPVCQRPRIRWSAKRRAKLLTSNA